MTNKKEKGIPTIETVWHKKFMTHDQFKKIKKHMGELEFSDEDNPEECRALMDKSIKVIKGLLERSILLDAYKDMTSDLYCTPSLTIVNPSMRKLFIFLGPEGKDVQEESDRSYRVWREL